LDEAKKRAKALLFARQQAYQKVFATKSKTTGESVKIVLADLKKFCRQNESCFDPDPRIHAAFEGRREVIIRILGHLELPQATLWEFYTGESDD